VGAAAGYVLQGLLDEGWTGVGLEPNRRMAELANRAGREVLVGTLEAPPEDLREKGPFDLVTMVQVVAHFHDLRRAFENAAALTKPGGLWLIETWDRSSWTARLFGRNWHEYSPPSVLHWFDRAGLAGLVSQFGMRTRAQGRPRKFISGGHARSLLRYKLEANALTRPLAWTTAVVPEHLPIPYPAEDLFWMLFQAAGKC
jgi:SAM-dependent methyltransferase